MAGQCWALIVLKVRLMRAMWTGVHTFSFIVTGLTLLVMLALSLGIGAGLFVLGWRLLPRLEEPLLPLAVLDSLVLFYSFFWAWGLLMELQRSEVIDLRKMLFLPISPRMVFVLNFVASLFGPSMIFFIPAATGLLAGLAMHYGPQVLAWGVPLAASFFIMLGAWAYYVRGWLAVLMENKRRRRLVLTLLPLAFVFIGQAPGIISAALQNLKGQTTAPELLQDAVLERALLLLNQALPPAWLPYGVWCALRGNPNAALVATAGCLATAALGLFLGYRATVRLYEGSPGNVAAAAKPQRQRRALTARRFPFLDEDTAALAYASFLGYLRHPNIRMLLIMPACMGLLVLFMYRSGVYGDRLGIGRNSEWAPIVVLVWPFFNFSYVLFNVFGIDRESFRGLVLLPTARYKFLLAKNLALFPFVGGMSITFVLAGALLLDMSARLTAVSALQVVQLFLLYAAIGNVISILLPHHIGWNGIRAGNSRVLMMCVGLLSAFLLGVLMLPTTVCLFIDDIARATWGYEGFPLAIPFSCAVLLATLGLYYFSLRHSGDLLRDREVQVLDRLLRDRE